MTTRKFLPVSVNADVEEAVAVVGVVLLVGNALGEHTKVAGGQRGCDVAILRGGVAAALDEDVLAIAGAANAYVEALVRFFEEERVLVYCGTQGVPVDPVLPLGLLVLDGVEEHGGVGGPGEGTDALGGVWQQVTGAHVLDVERVLAEAGLVCGVGEQVAVRADGKCAE